MVPFSLELVTVVSNEDDPLMSQTVQPGTVPVNVVTSLDVESTTTAVKPPKSAK